MYKYKVFTKIVKYYFKVLFRAVMGGHSSFLKIIDFVPKKWEKN